MDALPRKNWLPGKEQTLNSPNVTQTNPQPCILVLTLTTLLSAVPCSLICTSMMTPTTHNKFSRPVACLQWSYVQVFLSMPEVQEKASHFNLWSSQNQPAKMLSCPPMLDWILMHSLTSQLQQPAHSVCQQANSVPPNFVLWFIVQMAHKSHSKNVFSWMVAVRNLTSVHSSKGGQKGMFHSGCGNESEESGQWVCINTGLPDWITGLQILPQKFFLPL